MSATKAQLVTPPTLPLHSLNEIAPAAQPDNVGAVVVAERTHVPSSLASNTICRFYLRGTCRFGALCRFLHDTAALAAITPSSSVAASPTASSISAELPSTSRFCRHKNWVNAPVFVPARISVNANAGVHDGDNGDVDADLDVGASCSNKTWAEVVGGGEPGSMDEICPFENPCPYGSFCVYAVHLEQCKMCDQFCLHPTDMAQRRRHNQECLLHHEQAMELSFAIARSKDKTCGICFDTIMEKSGREKRFGILPNCSHIFCLECIRKWRQAKQFEHKITRSCPECRVSSDFVCPSAFWVETKEEKDKLLNDYRSALGVKDCKYFKKGAGKCPFGNKCFYKHALANGELVDVGCPKRGRKLQRNTNDFIDLLDIYLWEFVDQRDYHLFDMLSSSDDSDDSDWSIE